MRLEREMRLQKLQFSQLIEAYDEYIKLLGDELNEVVPLAARRGWKSSRVDEGIKLRAKIKEFKDQL